MDFEVSRQDFGQTRVVDAPPIDIGDGQVRLAVERFALTTNNITYAVAGDMLDYWGFFPTEAPWGRLPAMGLASVVESTNSDIEVGGRYFGFYPMSTEVVISAQGATGRFRDVGAHRAKHARAYTDFTDVADDAAFRDDRVDEYLLLRGVFMTSFLADDALGEQDFHGAVQTLVTSASSKTSICLADCLARRGHRSVGLTSPRNRAFVESLDLYNQVLTYDQINDLDPTVASGMVDMAGSNTVRSDVHNRFGDNLRFSSTVGATHRDDPAGAPADLAGATPEFFFAPGQIGRRTEQWGAAELARRLAEAFSRLLDAAPTWLTVARRTGPAEVDQVYRELLDGEADPAVGYVLSMSQAVSDG